MTESPVSALCHLTVRAPGRILDLAVPSDVPVADLLPALLRYSGEELEENGLDHGGWVLQRLGEGPLDDEGTLESLGLKDGEVLHLRPHADALPEVRLDDLVDAIADVMNDRVHGWSPAAGRRLLRGAVALCVLTGLGVLAWPGGPVALRAVTAAVAGLLLLAGAATAVRAVGDAAAGATLGFLAVPCLALSGWLLAGGTLSGPHPHHVLGARLLASGATAAGAAALALAATAVYPPLFVATAAVGIAAASAGSLMSVGDVPADGAGATVATVAVVLGAFVPSLSFKLAGLRLPPLPAGAQQLQEGIEPHNGGDVTARTELAGGWMTALYAATGAVCAGCLVALVRSPELPQVLTACTVSLLLLLHGRGLINVWQRLALVIPGLWGAALLVVGAAARMSPADRPALVVGLLALAAALAVASWTVPGRRMLPHWGRTAELLQSLLAIALLPLTLWTLGVFGALRAING
ncbi:type VII secretion integral membrane protein EccD [Streptomyces humidus]|uniref:Type VII secretion integral membrane protein EccD n=1 Tax=Streptomyces humidus TaxID=52259 RepID=A0A918FUP3_9ACTN|nr:type VII secretion integral membrane protein EccD [Streptomyces humidus]GGR86132.1 type VII secretion integral membrane protein EccD [Streptomyces humidus]